MTRGNPRRPAVAHSRRVKRQFDLDSAALPVEGALAVEELQDWLSVSVRHNCLTGIDGLYNPLLLGAVNDTEDLATSTIHFAPGNMWLNPLLDSGNGYGAVVSERAFAAAMLIVVSVLLVVVR